MAEVDLPPLFDDQAAKVRHTFRVRNTLPGPAKIASVTHSCACSRAGVAKAELQTGEKTELEVAADLSGKRGPQVLVCQVHLDSGEVWTYTVKTTVYQRAAFAPRDLHLGIVEPGRETVKQIELLTHQPSGEAAPQIVAVTGASESNSLRVSSGESHSARNGDGVTIHTTPLAVAVIPIAEPGAYSGRITAYYRRKGMDRQAELWATWMVRSAFDVAPKRVFFTRQAEGANLERTIRLKRHDEQPFAIRNIRVSDPAIHGTAAPSSRAAVHTVVVNIDNQDTESLIAGDVIVETDHPREPTIGSP